MQLDDILILLVIVGSIITSIVRTFSEQNKKRPPTQQRPQTGLPKQTTQTTQPGQPTQGDLQRRLEEARRRVQQAMEGQSGRGSEGEVGRPPSAPPPPFISGGLEGTSLEGQTLTGQTRERGSLEGQAQTRGTLESSGGLLQEKDYTLKPQKLDPQTLRPEEMKRERLEDAFSRGEKNVFRPIDATNRNPGDFQQQMTTVQPFIGEIAHRSERQITAALPQTRTRPRAPIGAQKHAKISGSELLSPEMLTEKELLRGFLWQQILSEPRSKVKLRTYSSQRARAEGKG